MFVLLAMLGAISFWGPTHPETHILEVAGVAIGYITYNLAAFFASRHEKWVRTRDLVIATAILDPLVLSAWLFIAGPRSEEYTSDLQSIMRIPYAVFCLKKKKTSQ